MIAHLEHKLRKWGTLAFIKGDCRVPQGSMNKRWTRGHGPRSSHSLWNFENLKKNDTFGPLGLKWGPKLKLCWLIWFSTNMTNVLWNFEYCSLKFFFKILTLPTPLGLKWGHKPKFFWLIWFSTNMTNVLWNFEHSSLKNKIFKILTLWGRGAQKGSLKWKFFIHSISAT